MKKILVTGGAGFIGSNLIPKLLSEGYNVICLDNLSTGSKKNIMEFLDHPHFKFINGDILDFELLLSLTKNVDIVSHQAAIGSVPRSIHDPLLYNKVNVEGTLNVFKASVDNKVDRVIYATSSSVYGDSTELPKREDKIGTPLSPYAVTKYINELYADIFSKIYGLNIIGLRYFNIFGPKQNSKGSYVAVVPLFIKAFLKNTAPKINGDGFNSRDFTFVENVVDANWKSIKAPIKSYNTIYNIAYGKNVSLNGLIKMLKAQENSKVDAVYDEERKGDIKHSLADISKAIKHLGYDPKYSTEQGLAITFDWYKKHSI